MTAEMKKINSIKELKVGDRVMVNGTEDSKHFNGHEGVVLQVRDDGISIEFSSFSNGHKGFIGGTIGKTKQCWCFSLYSDNFGVEIYLVGLNPNSNSIKSIYQNKGTTVVILENGSKGISRCSDNDEFDAVAGLSVAYMKAMTGLGYEGLSEMIPVKEVEVVKEVKVEVLEVEMIIKEKKFKVGDRVRIVNNTGNTEFNSLIGKEFTILDVFSGYFSNPYILDVKGFRGGGVAWKSSELELVEQEVLVLRSTQYDSFYGIVGEPTNLTIEGRVLRVGDVVTSFGISGFIVKDKDGSFVMGWKQGTIRKDGLMNELPKFTFKSSCNGLKLGDKVDNIIVTKVTKK